MSVLATRLLKGLWKYDRVPLNTIFLFSAFSFLIYLYSKCNIFISQNFIQALFFWGRGGGEEGEDFTSLFFISRRERKIILNWETCVFEKIRLIVENKAFCRISIQSFPNSVVANVDPSSLRQQSLISVVAIGLSSLGDIGAGSQLLSFLCNLTVRGRVTRDRQVSKGNKTSFVLLFSSVQLEDLNNWLEI